MASLFDMFSTGPAEKAAADQQAYIQQGMDALSKQYGQGRGALTTDYAAALAPWTQQSAYAGRGQNTLADALGLNGPEGNARATAAFQNNPGYQFSLDQGLNSVLAKNAQAGNLASGNTTLDELKFAQGLAGQNWQNYVGNLNPFLGAGQGAAGGIAGVNTGLGNQVNANYTGLGQGLAQGYGAMGNAQANADLAPYAVGKNALGAAMGAAQLAMMMPPTAWGGMGGGSSSPVSNPYSGMPAGSNPTFR
jgi:hypothetical protein